MLPFIDFLHPHGLFVIFIILYTVIERSKPLVASERRSWFELRENAAWYGMNIFLVPILVAGAQKYLIYMGVHSFGQNHSPVKFQIENPFILWTVIIVLKDFLDFINHYAFHRIPFLWKFHMIHHSLPQFNSLASFRFHWVEGVITDFFSSLPLFFLSASEEGIAYLALFEINHQIFCHSNGRMW